MESTYYPGKLLSVHSDKVSQAIKSGTVQVCVVGVGRIGLPSAVTFAHSGLRTIGVDINSELVKMINAGSWPLNDEPGFSEIFDQAVRKQELRATTDIMEGITKSDVIVLSLPTPMTEKNIPDYSALMAVGRSLNKLLEPDTIVIIESTVHPGFIENEFIPIIEGDGNRLKVGKNLGVAACPETANPGEILHDFKTVPRLVGATDERTARIVIELYSHVFDVEVLKMSDCKTANAAKLTANVFRDINIGFVNELAILFEKLGVDIMEVLAACDKKYNFQTHYPGAGVGGPCLPVNSYQMLNSTKKLDGMLRIVKAAREINERMPFHVIDLLLAALNEVEKPIKGRTICILGVSYKPDVRDIQLSPAEHIIDQLQHVGAKIKIYDPYFKGSQVYGFTSENSLEDGVANADAVVIVTPHKEFLDISPPYLLKRMSENPIIIDSKGIFDMRATKKAGFIYRGVGRGKI